MIRSALIALAMIGAVAGVDAATPSAGAAGPTLAAVHGTVMVSNGSQFVTAKAGQVLKTGDRVLVMQGASASLDYADGTRTALVPGTVVDVGSALVASRKVGPMYAQAVGDDQNRRFCIDDKGRIDHAPGFDLDRSYEADMNGYILDKDGNRRRCAGALWYGDHSLAITFAAWAAATAFALNDSHADGISNP